ncbi:MAG: hypothetical protein PHD11_07375 [Bacteroidales bacterium]|nr:hypothetical protein [Bacteroidales bacterium]MDD4670898.1 hypothetical protein [Bacteroidales bacterium]
MNFFFNRHRYSFRDVGMTTDIHCHILPGVDDGAGNMDSSVEIFERLYNAGVKQIVLTPHVSKGIYPNTTQILVSGFALLADFIPVNLKDALSLKLGAEYMIDDYFEEITDPLVYRNNTILIEMSYSSRSSNIMDVVFNLLNKGYNPILAHPERYVFYQGPGHHTPNRLQELEKLVDMGCALQLNIQSLTGSYGEGSLKVLKYLLDHDYYSYIATDIHSAGQFDLFKDFKVNSSQFEKIRQLAVNNDRLF